MKQLIGFIILTAVLFGCHRDKKNCCKPNTVIKTDTVVIYRDTSDSRFFWAIGQIESGNIDSITGDSGLGIGRFGIYDICLTGTGLKTSLGYVHTDMMDSVASRRVFWAMMGIFAHEHYKRNGRYPTYEELARKWCGGPVGDEKTVTLKYKNKFNQVF